MLGLFKLCSMFVCLYWCHTWTENQLMMSPHQVQPHKQTTSFVDLFFYLQVFVVTWKELIVSNCICLYVVTFRVTSGMDTKMIHLTLLTSVHLKLILMNILCTVKPITQTKWAPWWVPSTSREMFIISYLQLPFYDRKTNSQEKWVCPNHAEMWCICHLATVKNTLTEAWSWETISSKTQVSWKHSNILFLRCTP